MQNTGQGIPARRNPRTIEGKARPMPNASQQKSFNDYQTALQWMHEGKYEKARAVFERHDGGTGAESVGTVVQNARAVRSAFYSVFMYLVAHGLSLWVVVAVQAIVAVLAIPAGQFISGSTRPIPRERRPMTNWASTTWSMRANAVKAKSKGSKSHQRK